MTETDRSILSAAFGDSRACEAVDLLQQSRNAVLPMHPRNKLGCLRGFDTSSGHVERPAAFAAIHSR